MIRHYSQSELELRRVRVCGEKTGKPGERYNVIYLVIRRDLLHMIHP